MKHTGKLFLLIFLAATNALFAEDTDRAETAAEVDLNLINSLEAVVVTGERSRKKVSESTVNVKVVGREKMAAAGDTSLYQALRNLTGVTPETNCQNCNFDGVRLNGLDSRYNQILIGGIPLVSPLAEVYFYQSFPESLIERIEIVKGGGSALYGGGAVAGIINIIPREPREDFAELSLQESLPGLSASETYLSFAMSRSSAHSADSDSTPLSMMAFGSLSYATPYDRNDDGFSETSRKRASSLGLTVRRGSLRDGKLEGLFLYNEDNRKGGDSFDRADHQAAVREGTSARNSTAAVRYERQFSDSFLADIYQAVSYMERNAYFGGAGERYSESYEYDGSDVWGAGELENAVKGYSSTTNPLTVTGADATWLFSPRLSLLTGTMFTYEYIDDRQNGATTRTIFDAWDAGAYIQADAKPVKFWNIVLGIRVDKHSEIEDPIYSPRASSLVSFGEKAKWRVSYGSGFSAPRVYVEDFHLGVIAGESHKLINEAGLKPERSHSLTNDVTFDFDGMGIHWEPRVAGFYTRIEDAFSIESDSSNVNVRRNSDGLSVAGGEFEVVARKGGFSLTTGASLQKAEYDKEQIVYDDAGTQIIEKRLLKSPLVTGNAMLLYSWKSLSFSSDLVLHGPMKIFLEDPTSTPGRSEPGVYDTPIMAEWGARIAWSFFRERTSDYQLFTGVKNILDAYQKDLGTGATRDPAYVYGPAVPRTWYFGAKLKI